MTEKQAIEVLNQATAQLRVSRQEHQTILAALEVVNRMIQSKEQKEE